MLLKFYIILRGKAEEAGSTDVAEPIQPARMWSQMHAGEIPVDGVYGALWESSFLLLSLKYKKTRKKAGAPRDRQQTTTVIANKATGLWNIKTLGVRKKKCHCGLFFAGSFYCYRYDKFS